MYIKKNIYIHIKYILYKINTIFDIFIVLYIYIYIFFKYRNYMYIYIRARGLYINILAQIEIICTTYPHFSSFLEYS